MSGRVPPFFGDRSVFALAVRWKVSSLSSESALPPGWPAILAELSLQLSALEFTRGHRDWPWRLSRLLEWLLL